MNALTSSGTSTLVLPLLLGKKSCLGRPAMSVLVVQIKNRLKTQAMHIAVEKHGFSLWYRGKTRSTFTMELEIQEGPSSHKARPQVYMSGSGGAHTRSMSKADKGGIHGIR